MLFIWSDKMNNQEFLDLYNELDSLLRDIYDIDDNSQSAIMKKINELKQSSRFDETEPHNRFYQKANELESEILEITTNERTKGDLGFFHPFLSPLT